MSALTDRIARDHVGLVDAEYAYGCSCGCLPKGFQNWVAHIAAVTEAAVRKQVAQEIRAQRDRFRLDDLEKVAYDTAARIADGVTP